MTLQETLKTFGTALATIEGVTVRHYTRGKAAPPFLVWQEDGSDDFCADDSHSEGLITGSADYYTEEEYDPKVEQITQLLGKNALSWDLVSVAYEEQTGMIHYSWDWELGYG